VPLLALLLLLLCIVCRSSTPPPLLQLTAQIPLAAASLSNKPASCRSPSDTATRPTTHSHAHAQPHTRQHHKTFCRTQHPESKNQTNEGQMRNEGIREREPTLHSRPHVHVPCAIFHIPHPHPHRPTIGGEQGARCNVQGARCKVQRGATWCNVQGARGASLKVQGARCLNLKVGLWASFNVTQYPRSMANITNGCCHIISLPCSR
jgi:hypothetical protein